MERVSASPLIALYFVLAEHDENDGIVWALSPGRLNELQIRIKGLLLTENKEAKALIDDAFNRSSKHDKAIKIGSLRFNRVMWIFGNCCSSPNSPYMALTNGPIPWNLIVSWFALIFRTKNVDSLIWLGIRDAYLFPDLEHLAQEVTATYEKSTSA